MATLFQWTSGNGSARRCDSKCHNAKLPRCKCICGGRYHGCATKPAGLETARQHMKANIAYWQDQEARAAAEQQRDEVHPPDLQLSIFDRR